MENSTVISVNTIPEREKMIKDLYKSLTSQANKKFTIVQDRVNRIRIYHIKGSLKMLVNTYIVIVIPVSLNLSPLDEVYGTVDFRLDKTIDCLLRLIHKLQSMQGKKVIKGKTGAGKLQKALTQLF